MTAALAPQVPDGNPARARWWRQRRGADVLALASDHAFFVGSIVTDALGHAVVTAKLPDNLTTFAS
jgi:uncharacterized protein YfaS (alpha-2-macroglobulin family)